MRIEKLGRIGARVHGVDVTALGQTELREIERVIYEHSVVAFTDQRLHARSLVEFSRRLGALYRNPTSPHRDAEYPEVMILSNKVADDGKRLGIPDAGQDWHTDMSYNALPGRLTVLYGLEIPHRDGLPLGNTRFADMYGAYDALPQEVRERIAGRDAQHDFHKFYDRMVEKNGARVPLTAEQRNQRPPARHPMVGTHPITGRRFLYANPGYVVRALDCDPDESERLLAFLFEFQVRHEFCVEHVWRPRDLLVWDDWSTIHMAIADYRPDEPRYMLRTQVVGSRSYHD